MALIIPTIMSKINKIDHAKHNEEVCNFLSPQENYIDWVITTAFYSAIHYVDHKLFPMKVNHESGSKFTIKSIDEYRNNFPKKGIDKHTYRAELVQSRCAPIHANFLWLRSASGTARYSNYIFSKPKEVLVTAKKHLEAISIHCS